MQVVKYNAPKLDFFPVTNLNVREIWVMSQQKRRPSKPFTVLFGHKIRSDANYNHVPIYRLQSLAHHHYIPVENTYIFEGVPLCAY